MDKYQEALDRLSNDDYDFPHDFYEEDKVSAMERDIDTLQKLIDKATPKKPIERHYEDEGEPEYIKVCCPAGCKVQVGNYYNFCPECGQALDWSSKMIDPERKIKINGHDIEEYLWRGELLVYIDGLLFGGKYEEAQRKCWEDR